MLIVLTDGATKRERYALAVAGSGQVLSSTYSRERAAEFDEAAVGAVSGYYARMKQGGREPPFRLRFEAREAVQAA